jgi:hypothetical protein
VRVRYNVNNGQEIEFFVPGRGETMRTAAYSVRARARASARPAPPPWLILDAMRRAAQCNGFSAGVNPDDFRGPGFASGYDPVWVDLLLAHAARPFHVLMGGGDQLYCDGCVCAVSAQALLVLTGLDTHLAYAFGHAFRAASHRSHRTAHATASDCSRRTALLAPHRTAPHCTALHRTAPLAHPACP